MSSLTVKRLVWRVSTTLSDVNPQFTRYSERDIITALQCGTRALCKFLPHVGTRTVAMKLSPGTRQSIAKIVAANTKTLDGSEAVDVYGISLKEVLRNKGADGLTVGRSITIADRQVMDLGDPDWHTRTGTTVREFTFDPLDPLTFFVSPGVPSATDVWVDVSVVALPLVIPDGGEPGSEIYADEGISTQVVGIDDTWEDELWNYTVAYVLLSDSKAQAAMVRAQQHAQAFMASINLWAQQLTGQNPNLKTLPFAPEPQGQAS